MKHQSNSTTNQQKVKSLLCSHSDLIAEINEDPAPVAGQGMDETIKGDKRMEKSNCNLEQVLNELQAIIDDDNLNTEDIHQIKDFVRENFNQDGSLTITLQDD